MNSVISAIEYVGIAGQLLLLYLLLRGPLRRYYLIFLYVLVELIGTTAAKYVIATGGRQGNAQFRDVFFAGDVIGLLLVFFVVIMLTYQVMEGSPLRAKVQRLLGVIAALALVLPFVIYRDEWFTTAWYNGTLQLLNFGAAIMTLILWTALIARKTRDPQLLMVCAGLGVAVAFNAIGWGLRKFTISGGDARVVANLLLQLIYLVRIGIWCWAFRPQKTAQLQPKVSVG